MGKKRTASESRHGAEKPFQKHEKGQNQSKGNHHGGRGSKSAPSGQKSSLTFQPRPDWHAAELPSISTPDEFVPAPRYVLDDVYQYAESLLEFENKTYADSNMSADSSHKFLSTIQASGTLEDKVSALTLLIQESPLHTIKAFENLLGLARKKSRNQALLALGALKDLLGQGVVLPPDRKLRSFVKQPAVLAAFSGPNANWKNGQRLPPGIENVHLISWAYEDWLKRTYFEMLRILEGWCNDEVEYSRSRAITFVYELLKEKPEQEENLLRLLINKLGDNEKKIASRASYLLLQLQNSHPVMKGIIIGAIESECLFRPNQSPHAKYYAIITLNQTILSAKEPEVANKLLEIYFALFLSLLKNGPKSDVQDYKKAQQGGGGQAGKKAKQKAKAKEKEQEKAANAESELNEKLIAGVLTGVNRAFPYAKTDDVAFEKQLDTVFRVTHSSNFNTAIQALLLIQQISATKHYSTDRFYRTLYESLLDPRLLHSSKQVMYLNLLYRSLKADVSIKRVKAFVKRLLQVITLHDPPFVCGVLYLIYELTKTFPSIKTMLETPELDDEDEEEHFVDAPEEGDDTTANPAAAPETKPSTTTGPHYDGRKRDPDHAHADLSCLWDLTPLRLHFHPSVSLFASRLLYGAAEMPPKPDPTLHTLMHFLDRFAYRNVRQKGTAQGGGTKGVSIMQPMAGSATKADLLVRAGGDAAKLEAPLNSEAFWRKKVEDVPADEVFFHQYFEKSGAAAQKKGKRQGKTAAAADDDEEEGGSDAEEQEIWKALVGSRPDVAGPDEEDDEDLEELDELMGAGESEDESDGEEDEDGGVVIADAPDDDEEDEDEEMVDAKAEKKKEKKKSKAKDEVEEDEASDAGFDFDDGDEGAFIGSDEELELPSDFDWEDAEEDDEEEVQEEKPKKGKKGKKGEKKAAAAAAVEEEAGEEEDKDKRGKKRRKLKHLPTFASVEDYAKLLGDDSDGY